MMDPSMPMNIFMHWTWTKLRFRKEDGGTMTTKVHESRDLHSTEPLGIREVCKLQVDIGDMPHQVVSGHLGGSHKLYKRFDYNLRLSFGNNGVLGFVLESVDGEEHGRQAAAFSTIG